MHPTEQLNTALAGRYSIERRLGAGGMAVVYLARDLKHNRHVALKVLNPELGAVLGAERFTAEIDVTANLQHPNLLPLFDSGEAAGLLYYTMPFIEGETLRARLERERQLGVDEALRIAVSICGALDYAHRHGVIHRDLKPENILLHEGQPLVMDFGIALAVSKAGGARITQTGLSLGTPQYMSPEQATGDHVLDGRSDLYSLGVILYEMLIGDPPHKGSTVQAVIARVLTEQPTSVRAMRPTVPEPVDSALMMALAKLPADRFATAADFAAALEGKRPVSLPASAQTMSSHARRTAAPSRARESVAWIVAVLGVASAAVIAGRPRVQAPEAGTLGRFAIAMPESVEITRTQTGRRVAISRDGARFAMTGQHGARSAVYMWSANNTVGQIVPGTEGAGAVTFSPNGQWLLVSMPDRLEKIPVTGGAPSIIVSVDNTDGGGPVIRGASWGDNGAIVFVRGSQSELWSVTADGAGLHRLAAPDTMHGIQWLGVSDILPGGTHALVGLYARAIPSADSIPIGVMSLADGSIEPLGIFGAGARYVAPGFLVFGRSGGVIYATPFSLRRRQVTGSAVRVLDGVTQGLGAVPDIALADNGWLVYHVGNVAPVGGQLVVVDQTGHGRALELDEKAYVDPAISPDGQHLLARVAGRTPIDGHLWIYDFASHALSLLTNGSSYQAKWSRDGKRIIYMTGPPDRTRIASRPWDGSGAESVLVTKPLLGDVEPGPVGGYTAIRALGGAIYVAPTESLSAVRPFLVGPANGRNPALSPDGKWLAYESDETDRREVYVRPVPGPGPRTPISVAGGTSPRWSHDGTTLFYRGTSALIAARLALHPTLSVVRRDSLFADTYSKAGLGRFDVFPNDRDFVFVKGDHPREGPSMYLIVNWRRLLTNSGGALHVSAP